jgi:hypothetical protein
MNLISTFRKQLTLVVALLILLLASCSTLTMEEQLEAKYYATQYAKDPANNIPPPKYQTLAATALGMYLPATPVPTSTPDPHWTPTMSFYDFSGTQVAQQQNYQMTQNAQQLAVEQARLAAEERARREAEEAKHAQETAIAYSQQQTAEARVWFAQQTANAQSTQIMGTQMAAATATMWAYQIDQQNTAVAGAATAAVQPTHAIWTQNAVYAVQTIEAGEAAKVELAVRRQNMKNIFDALLPWAIVVGAIIVLARGFAEWVKTRVHSRDEHGRVPLIQMKTDSGDTIVVKPELMESSTMKIQKDGAIVRYAPMDTQEQSDINRRAQAVEAIAALPTPYAQTGTKIVTSEFNSTRARVTIGNPASMGPVLDEADRGFLEEAKND